MTSVQAFDPLTWEGWLVQYKPKIRVMVSWSDIDPQSPKTILVGRQEKLFSPWYTKGSWAAGSPAPLDVGEKLVLVRAPAVKVAGKFLVLDGNHRISELRPAIVLLDYIEPKGKSLRAFVDVINPFWKGEGS